MDQPLKEEEMKGRTLLFVFVAGLSTLTGRGALAGGPVFGAPHILNSSATLDAGSDFRPSLASDGNGNWVATWYYSNDGDPDLRVSYSSDDGVTWSPNALLNSAGTTDADADDYPTVATDKAGNWVVVWALDPAGPTTSDIMVTRSSDNGATWSAQEYLDLGAPGSESFNDYYPIVASSGAGTWISAWRRDVFSDPDLYFSRSTNNGVTWTTPSVPNAYFDTLTDNGLDDIPSLASDGTGNWVMVFYSGGNLGGTIPFSGNIFVMTSADDGATWSAPTYLNSNAPTDTAYDAYGVVATDKLGTWVTVWNSDSTLGGTIGSDSDILVSRSIDNGATWSAAAPLNSDAATDSRSDTSPVLVFDGNDRWVAMWTANAAPGFLVSESRDGGVTWSAPQPMNASAIDDAGFELFGALGVDGDSYVVAWSSDENIGGTTGTDLEILFTHGIACPYAPTSGCVQSQPGRSSLAIKDASDDAKNALTWKWGKGAATTLADFLDPVNGDPYLLCVYDAQSGPLKLRDGIGLHGAGTCGGKPCWSTATKGAKYKDKAGSQGGATALSVSIGESGKSKASFKAKGLNLAMPSLPLVGPVTVQMRNRDFCWTSAYSAPFKQNDAAGFKDSGD